MLLKHTPTASPNRITHLVSNNPFLTRLSPTMLALINKQSMKMIASTKLNKAQRAMAAAKAYGAANNGKLFGRTTITTAHQQNAA